VSGSHRARRGIDRFISCRAADARHRYRLVGSCADERGSALYADRVAVPSSDHERRLRLPSWPWLLLGALGLVATAWIVSGIADRVANINLEAIPYPYVVVASFVVFDAIIPILPSESLLNTGAILATGDDSPIQIWRLIVAGSVGAVVGDTLLYWISRTVLRRFMADRVEQAQGNKKIADALGVLEGEAPLLIVGGRFVPGVRFVVGATMGLARYPFPQFLLWDAIGGTLWASFACLSSALVATAIGGQPLVSIIVSALITTALLGFLYRRLKRSTEAPEAG
jgi:membrane protein DedA with SNARE-associated domain